MQMWEGGRVLTERTWGADENAQRQDDQKTLGGARHQHADEGARAGPPYAQTSDLPPPGPGLGRCLALGAHGPSCCVGRGGTRRTTPVITLLLPGQSHPP